MHLTKLLMTIKIKIKNKKNIELIKINIVNCKENKMTENKSVVKVKDENGWDEALEKESWVAPLVDIYETNDNFYLNANMPGVTRENIKIKMEDGSLVLMGRIDYDEKLNRKYVLKETEMGNFYRKFNISDSIDESKIDAKFENGQLILTLPKQARIKPKTIEIN